MERPTLFPDLFQPFSYHLFTIARLTSLIESSSQNHIGCARFRVEHTSSNLQLFCDQQQTVSSNRVALNASMSYLDRPILSRVRSCCIMDAHATGPLTPRTFARIRENRNESHQHKYQGQYQTNRTKFLLVTIPKLLRTHEALHVFLC